MHNCLGTIALKNTGTKIKKFSGLLWNKLGIQEAKSSEVECGLKKSKQKQAIMKPRRWRGRSGGGRKKQKRLI